jgi:DNA invertase Pin-like site-specific DNA recombinase
MKTIVYLRTSTEDQTPENQLKDILNLVDENYETIIDKQSAWKDNKEREGFEKLNSLIKSNKVSNLYVWDLDRIYRNRSKLLGFFQFCKSHNCNIWSYRQKFLNEIQEIELPKGFEFIKEMMVDNFLQFLGWIAEDESMKKSERVKLAVRRHTGKPTKSYKGNKWGRKAMSDNVDKEILEARNKGMTIREIADSVFYWDKNNNRKKISIAYVHKTLKKHNL